MFSSHMQTALTEIVRGLPLVLEALVLFWISRMVYDWTTRFRLNEELVEKNNPAVGLSYAGYNIAFAICLVGTLVGPDKGLTKNLQDVALYGAIAIVLLNLARFLIDAFTLYRFRIHDELIGDRNVGTGAVLCGAYLATGLIINGSTLGEEGGAISTVVFFLLGQLFLILGGWIFQGITRYDVHGVISEKDNAAAGISFGGFFLALGFILRASIIGNPVSWSVDLAMFALYGIVGLVLLGLIRFFADKVLLPGHDINEEVGTQANTAAALVLVAAFLLASLVITAAL